MAQDYEALLQQILQAAACYSNGTAQAAPAAPAPAAGGLEPIPVGISNRHLHLSQADLDVLFGPGYELTKIKDLKQELLLGDSFKLGIKPPTRMSGDLAGSAGCTLVGPKGTVVLQEGAIVAQRHIHMTAAEAAAYGVTNGQVVSIEFDGPRCGILGNVAIRAGEGHALECHVDTEEANALAITSKTTFKLIK